MREDFLPRMKCHIKRMAFMRHFVILMACLTAVHAATTNAQEETCAELQGKQQLLQARNSLSGTLEEEEKVTNTRRASTCPWHMTEGQGCHQNRRQKAKCKDGTFSFSCNKGGHGERQQCPCTLPYMCAEKRCGEDGQDYCCERSCEDFGGIRPCNGQEEAEPTDEPMVPQAEPTPTPAPTPVPTPAPPKTCYNDTVNTYTSILGKAEVVIHDEWSEDARNTVIEFNAEHSKNSVQYYQNWPQNSNHPHHANRHFLMGTAFVIITLKANGYSDEQLKKMTDDDQLNTLVALDIKCMGKPVPCWDVMKLTPSHCTLDEGTPVPQIKGKPGWVIDRVQLAGRLNRPPCCP